VKGKGRTTKKKKEGDKKLNLGDQKLKTDYTIKIHTSPEKRKKT